MKPAAEKVLVTGAGGQLGHDLVSECRRHGDDVTGLSHAQLDIADPAAVTATVGDVEPDVIINCAAWTAVDACEADPERANRINGDAVGILQRAAEDVGAHLVQISTDYVFDGTLDRPYREDDETNPQSVYGRSKLAGEQAAGAAATIVRTSWVCGEHGNNMVRTVLGLLSPERELRFVDDQIGNPSFTADLAPALRELALSRTAGIFHLTNATPGDVGVSWYEFVRQIAIAAGHDPAVVIPIHTAQLDPPRPAPRPANSVLDNTKLANLRDYREPLAELVARLGGD